MSYYLKAVICQFMSHIMIIKHIYKLDVAKMSFLKNLKLLK